MIEQFGFYSSESTKLQWVKHIRNSSLFLECYLEGEWNCSLVRLFKGFIQDAISLNPKMIALNLRSNSFICSCSIGVIINSYRQCQKLGIYLCIVEPENSDLRKIDLMKLMNIDIHADLQKAIEHFEKNS